jgi:hypothetical protein
LIDYFDEPLIDSDVVVGTGSGAIRKSQLITRVVNANGYGAIGDGRTDSSKAIQKAIDYVLSIGGQNVWLESGEYVATGLNNAEKINFVGEGASFVNKIYEIFSLGTQTKSQRMGKGQQSGNVFVSTEGTHKEIADIDSVALQVVSGSRTENSVDYPRVWGMNTIVAKHQDYSNSYVVGLEVSMVNKTADHMDVIGVLSSYVGLQEGGKSAFESEGNIAGWTYGMILDGIKTNGFGIVLQDNVSNNGGLSIGIDLSLIQSYSNGAVVLGNTHDIRIKNSIGTANKVLRGTATDDVVLGGDMGGTGYLLLRSAGSGVSLQNKAGTNHLIVNESGANPVQIYVGGALKNVEVGAVDSAGAGYRQLRVTN